MDTSSDATTQADGAGPTAGLTVERALNLLLIMVRQQMRGRDRQHRESMDVVQSIAADLLSQRSGFLELDPQSQRRYLNVVARHKLGQLARRDRAQKRGGNAGPVAVDDAGEPASSTCGPGTLLCEQHELDAMREALDRLEPETRSVLALQASGVPHEAIAELIQTSDQAARQRFVRAKRDLIILARRSAGDSWEHIAEGTGLTAEQAQARHDRLRSID